MIIFKKKILFLKIFSNDHLVNEIEYNMLRYVMNYLSAVYALKSLVQRQIKHLSVTEDFMKRYEIEICKIFKENSLARFVEGCRNSFIHESIPFSITEL